MAGMTRCTDLASHVDHVIAEHAGWSLDELAERARREWEEEQWDAALDAHWNWRRDESRTYRAEMRDAGRGELVR